MRPLHILSEQVQILRRRGYVAVPEDCEDQGVDARVLERLRPIAEHDSQRRFTMGADDPLLQSLRPELHQRRSFPLLMEPSAQCVHRAEPCVARVGSRGVHEDERRTPRRNYS